jgi:hypothetical protein
MDIADIIIIVILVYYTLYMFTLFDSKKRKSIQFANMELDKLRKIPIKTLEDQKRFLDLKHPKKKKSRFSWRSVPSIAWKIAVFVGLFQLYSYLLSLTGYSFRLWQTILFAVFFPILVNFVLARFKVEKSDMLAFFRKQ